MVFHCGFDWHFPDDWQCWASFHYLAIYRSSLCSHSVVFNSLQSHGPIRLFCPWNFPGKNTWMGCHFLLQGIFRTQGSNPLLLHLLHWQVDASPVASPENVYSDLLFLNQILCVFICFCYCCTVSSYILDIFPLSNTWFANISHSVGCLFILLMALPLLDAAKKMLKKSSLTFPQCRELGSHHRHGFIWGQQEGRAPER